MNPGAGSCAGAWPYKLYSVNTSFLKKSSLSALWHNLDKVHNNDEQGRFCQSCKFQDSMQDRGSLDKVWPM